MAELQGWRARIEYVLGTRVPLAEEHIRLWFLKLPVLGRVTQILQEADYTLGDHANVAVKRNVQIPTALHDVGLKVGHQYRLGFEAQYPSKNFTLPGDGFLELGGIPQKLRIYKIAFREPNFIDCDVCAYEPKQLGPSGGAVSQAGALPVVPISTIVACLAIVLIAVFGYLILKTVHEIIVSPSGLIIAAIALVLFWPAIKGSISRRGP